jgi:hypothetical protein
MILTQSFSAFSFLLHALSQASKKSVFLLILLTNSPQNSSSFLTNSSREKFIKLQVIQTFF